MRCDVGTIGRLRPGKFGSAHEHPGCDQERNGRGIGAVLPQALLLILLLQVYEYL